MSIIYKYFIEFLFGFGSGVFLGMTGIIPIGFIILVLDYLKFGDYRSNLGAIMFLNLFPLSIGSFMNFYKANLVDYELGIILLVSVILGSYMSSLLVVNEKYQISVKNIKYITSFLGFFIGITYLISAMYEKN